MNIFDSIKNAIFGKAKPKPAPAQAAPQAQAAASQAQPAPAPTPAAEPVDVAEILDAEVAASGQPSNWRTSIVDLMKLLELDSSLGHRKALAKELGYTGDMDDSASMNIWLHKQVMAKLAQNGGKVPAEFQD